MLVWASTKELKDLKATMYRVMTEHREADKEDSKQKLQNWSLVDGTNGSFQGVSSSSLKKNKNDTVISI